MTEEGEIHFKYIVKLSNANLGVVFEEVDLHSAVGQVHHLRH